MGKYRLYLDESGDFRNDNTNLHQNPSLVGGILVKDNAISTQAAEDILISIFKKTEVHANREEAQKRIATVEEIKNRGATLVIFENKERANILNNHLTYLNVVAEGIVKLKQRLIATDKHATLEVVIATRTVEREEGERKERIAASEYHERLQEKLHLEIARGNLSRKYLMIPVSYAVATKDPHLKLSDFVCNLYLIRTSTSKFDEAQRKKIQELYKDCFYSSFIETNEERIQEMILKGHKEEAIFIALTEDDIGMTMEAFVQRYLSKEQTTEKELSNYLSQIMHRIDNLIVNNFDYSGTKRILNRAYDELLYEIKRQGIPEDGRFELDILLYQYAIQTHTGDDDVWESDKRFQAALKNTTDLLVRMKYYIKYQNRRAMNFKNYFYYEEAIGILDETISHVKDFVDLMQFLEPNEETPIAYEELGKLYGSKGMNLLVVAYQEDGQYEEAIENFKLGKQQFYYEQDQQRQDIYIAASYIRAGQFEKGLMYLIHQGEAPFDAKAVAAALQLWLNDCVKHIFYLNVFMFGLNHAKQAQHDIANWMEEALQQASFKLETYLEKCENGSFVTKALISWHYGYYMYLKGDLEKSLIALKLAAQCLETSLESSLNRFIHLGILATQLRVERAKGKAQKQENDFAKKLEICINELPDEHKAHFLQYFELEALQMSKFEDAQLEKLIRRTWAI